MMAPKAQAPSPPPRLVTAEGLRLSTAIDADGAVFARFFAGYDKAFVLANEKEDEAGFRRCFALNFGDDYARLSVLYGPYSEVCLIAEKDGVEIGGANFIAMPIDARTVSANLNYIYINQGARGRGHLARLLGGVRETLAALFSDSAQTLVFVEQNDPFRMSAQDYRRDTEFTGLDQFDRLRIWAKLGARVVDFAYAQPPLSAEQDADDTLVYSVLGAETLSACALKAHLTRFFGVSVLKGADIASNAPAQAQLAALEAACGRGESIALRDPARLLGAIRRREDAVQRWPSLPDSFRAALAAF